MDLLEFESGRKVIIFALGLESIFVKSIVYFQSINTKMNKDIRKKIIEICDSKILSKGENVGLSFYAFFKNKNDNPKLLMEVATWWIEENELDHFEKAVKIKHMVKFK